VRRFIGNAPCLSGDNTEAQKESADDTLVFMVELMPQTTLVFYSYPLIPL
jgi:hypothetical protein